MPDYTVIRHRLDLNRWLDATLNATNGRESGVKVQFHLQSVGCERIALKRRCESGFDLLIGHPFR